MNEFVQQILIALIPALVIAAVTAYLTVKWSIRQFHSQRWWELKAEAYSQIIAQLVDLQYYIERSIEMLRAGGELDFETNDELYEGYFQAKKYLRKATASGAYVISDGAAAALEELMRGLDNEEPSIALWIQTQHSAVKECAKKMREYAKVDLHKW